MDKQKFIKTTNNFFVDADYADAFTELGLNSIDAIFEFNTGQNLDKNNLGKHRSRVKFELASGQTFFLKRYDCPPISNQLKNWFSHRKRALTCDFDRLPGLQLIDFQIDTPKVIAYGGQWSGVFEKRSFIITQKLEKAEALERRLPDCFYEHPNNKKLKQRRRFIEELADFAKLFHKTGFCHRDFYLAHIFRSNTGQLFLIDLQRAFKPIMLGRRFRVKDIAQLYYSAPGKYFTRADRMRFYLRYTGKTKLTWTDRMFIHDIKTRARRMARHDIRHNREAGFAI